MEKLKQRLCGLPRTKYIFLNCGVLGYYACAYNMGPQSLFDGVPLQYTAEGSICLCCPQDSEPSNEVVAEAPGKVVPSTSRSSSEELVSVAQKHPEEVGPSVSILFQT